MNEGEDTPELAHSARAFLALSFLSKRLSIPARHDMEESELTVDDIGGTFTLLVSRKSGLTEKWAPD